MPFKFPSALYVVIGLVVVFVKDYLDSLGTISKILTALLAILLWPLVLLGFDVRSSRYTHPPVMAGERIRLEVKEREEVGTRVSKRLRRQGLIPGVLYGRSEPHSISIPERELRRALTSEGGLNAILDVVLEGQKTTHPSILKEYQQDPVKGRVTHVDFQEVRLDQPIHATVPVHLIGAEDSPGIREGGVLSQISRDVNVEALPMEIPEHLDLDVSGMQMNDTLRLSDLSAPEGVKLLDDPEETVLATVSMPAIEVEPEPVEEELAEGEVAEGEEGEAPEGAADESAGGEAAGEQPGTTDS